MIYLESRIDLGIGHVFHHVPRKQWRSEHSFIIKRCFMIGDKTMNVSITQMRLAMRLDSYLKDYKGKNVRNATLHGEEWNNVWHIADAARINSTLTPELVDDVRVALKKL
jgi:hypothetical protein